MAYQMFTGELDGQLVLGHIKHRAGEVRHSISEMFFDAAMERLHNLGESVITHTDATKEAWRIAKAHGWKVVPVFVMGRDEWFKHTRHGDCV